MGWYTDLVEGASNLTGISSDVISGAAQLGLGAVANNYFRPDVPKVGYQGKIPDLQAVRERVPNVSPEGRRPGEAGQRYFSDVQYAKRPDTKAATVAEAQAVAKHKQHN